jgi:hypothetical protein
MRSFAYHKLIVNVVALFHVFLNKIPERFHPRVDMD